MRLLVYETKRCMKQPNKVSPIHAHVHPSTAGKPHQATASSSGAVRGTPDTLGHLNLTHIDRSRDRTSNLHNLHHHLIHLSSQCFSTGPSSSSPACLSAHQPNSPQLFSQLPLITDQPGVLTLPAGRSVPHYSLLSLLPSTMLDRDSFENDNEGGEGLRGG